MAIRSVEACFKTTDGNEYKKKEDAEHHQELIDATNELQHAQERFERLTVEECRTADGELFDVRRFSDYYFISSKHRLQPVVMPVRIDRHRWRLGSPQNTTVEIHLLDDREKSFVTYRIDELYSKLENARKACIEKMKEYIGWMKDDLAEMEAEIKGR